MNAKKIIIIIPLLLMSVFAMASCYGAWNRAYSNATAEYNSDMNRCRGEISGRCSREANLSYGQALDSAADAYWDCVM